MHDKMEWAGILCVDCRSQILFQHFPPLNFHLESSRIAFRPCQHPQEESLLLVPLPNFLAYARSTIDRANRFCELHFLPPFSSSLTFGLNSCQRKFPANGGGEGTWQKVYTTRTWKIDHRFEHLNLQIFNFHFRLLAFLDCIEINTRHRP